MLNGKINSRFFFGNFISKFIMSKSKQKKKVSQLKRKQMVEEVFKKGKKQRDIAKKFDEKIAQKQGSTNKREKLQQLRSRKRSDGNFSRQHVADLDKKLDTIRANRKPGQSVL